METNYIAVDEYPGSTIDAIWLDEAFESVGLNPTEFLMEDNTELIDDNNPPKDDPFDKYVYKSTGVDDNTTQKVRGILALENHGTLGMLKAPKIKGILPGLSYSDIETKFNQSTLFVRPCPSLPKHGWVDSRVCSTFFDALKLAMEVWSADPMGQVLFMDKLPGTWSAVVTETTISIGAGHAGATSGESSTLPIPTTFDVDLKLKSGVMEDAGAYLEVVDGDEAPVMVQLRAGPKSVTGEIYIPEGVEVGKTDYYKVYILPINEEPNLIAWDQTVSKSNRSIFVFPGRSMSSHYVVHALINNKIVVTGDTASGVISASNDIKTVKLYGVIKDHEKNGTITEPHNWDVIRSSFNKWINQDLPHDWLKYAGVNGIGILHSLPFLDGNYDDLIGAGIAWTFQSMAASVVGEARHWSSCITTESNMSNRRVVHCEVWKNTPKYAAIMNKWRKEQWLASQGWGPLSYHDGKQGVFSGIGGKRWQDANDLAIKMFNAVKRKNGTAAFKLWNLCVQTLHNGGRTVIGKVFEDAPIKEIDTQQGTYVTNSLMAYFLGYISVPVKMSDIERMWSKIDVLKELYLDSKWSYRGRNAEGMIKPADESFHGGPWVEGDTWKHPDLLTADMDDVLEEYMTYEPPHFLKHWRYWVDWKDECNYEYEGEED